MHLYTISVIKAVLESVHFANRDVISTTLSQTVFLALGGW